MEAKPKQRERDLEGPQQPKKPPQRLPGNGQEQPKSEPSRSQPPEEQ